MFSIYSSSHYWGSMRYSSFDFLISQKTSNIIQSSSHVKFCALDTHLYFWWENHQYAVTVLRIKAFKKIQSGSIQIKGVNKICNIDSRSITANAKKFVHKVFKVKFLETIYEIKLSINSTMMITSIKYESWLYNNR